MSKPIKCPSCNVSMDILSNLVSGEDDLYSAKVECPSCLSRFTPVLASTETRARRLAALKCRAWIAKLKTCDNSGGCAFQFVDLLKKKSWEPGDNYFPAPPRAPRSRDRSPGCPPGVYIYAAPNGDLGGHVIYGSGFPDVVTMYMASGPSVTYSSDATVTTTDGTSSVVKMSVDELMNLRSQGLSSDTEVTASEDRIIKEFEKNRVSAHTVSVFEEDGTISTCIRKDD